MRNWFPDREFFMRSQGQVRFITISSRVQIIAAAAALAILSIWVISMAVAGWTQYRATTDRLSLLDREAKVATATERVNAYRDNLDAVTSDLVKRQDFIEDMVASLPEDVKAVENVSDSATEAAATIDKVSLAIPEAAELARIEARQLAFVEGLTRYADWRAAKAADALKQLGLNPDTMIRQADRSAMGGPLEKLATSVDGTIDPRFERLGLSIARMSALENGLAGVPQVAPASVEMVTSSFGYRRDPFTGAGAMHQGLDFRGPKGAPIYAAAAGRVTFVGRKSGYGKTVEITHGNGLMTRYAHMSAFRAKVGDQVAPGQTIGAIGSTGRSTGPHLHFEVRINNRAVNPRTFLETAPHVLEEIRRAPQLARAD
ncbi:M23 family metallopeptidase [Qipengyuania sp. XHP0207]|uniref:M23 family metallopeptidase n=1 Tax=Qipengyuania sp. XHP0207 TaxID=3038078 RepID=UPI00241E982F|nr:M23 family metallopeptidase [Qipengyuania sp. XHP0207]MDG5748127.1 M23 family metallopeptidase [Qipengyuania sp. XHP0207]